MLGTTTAAVMALISGLHVVWANGIPFPFRSTDRLNDAVLGGASNSPSAAECYGVAVALAVGSTAVHRAGSSGGRGSRLLSTGVVVVLGARGALGLAGATHRLVPGATSSTFRRLDRWVYSPLCLALAGGAASAVLAGAGRSGTSEDARHS
ncbi:MAG: DUF3995 domain-containing protein [Acidimicrobiales bacterium]